MTDKFLNEIGRAYHSHKGEYLTLGAAMLNAEALNGAELNIPLSTLNRHGLIAGATGTGKTVSLQVLAEQLSLKGVPCLLMDLKGDLSGLGAEGTNNKHIVKRHSFLSEDWNPDTFPLELLSLGGDEGTRLKATVTEFGPILMAKILGLNDTQRGILSVIFKYCDDHKLPLIDLKDLKEALHFSIGEGKSKIQEEYGQISKVSVSTILRKILELEQQGADSFFQERSFEVEDLCRTEGGKGMISIIRLSMIKDKPKLFSTFMLSLLAEVYARFPEEGDLDKPKLCIFIDEAHLIFDEASKELLDQIESIIKLIRSKGVGIFFCTQQPTDIPDDVLSQLGLKVQHALRAFTAKDRKEIKKISENFPSSDYYQVDEVLTQLGIGEAFITALNEKGIPTPLARCLMRPPKSRMGLLDKTELKAVLNSSELAEKYNEEIDRESAYEILREKISLAKEEELKSEEIEEIKQVKRKSSKKADDSIIGQLSKNTMVRQVGRTVARELMRGLLGALGVKPRRRSYKRK